MGARGTNRSLVTDDPVELEKVTRQSRLKTTAKLTLHSRGMYATCFQLINKGKTPESSQPCNWLNSEVVLGFWPNCDPKTSPDTTIAAGAGPPSPSSAAPRVRAGPASSIPSIHSHHRNLLNGREPNNNNNVRSCCCCSDIIRLFASHMRQRMHPSWRTLDQDSPWPPCIVGGGICNVSHAHSFMLALGAGLISPHLPASERLTDCCPEDRRRGRTPVKGARVRGCSLTTITTATTTGFGRLLSSTS